MGHGLAVMSNTEDNHACNHEELAVVAYCLGKISRALAAVGHGQTPSDDTWHDIAVYAKMAQWIREKGQWL
jgi:hypothetical protein